MKKVKIFLIILSFMIFTQNVFADSNTVAEAVSLRSEISRLERISLNAPGKERFDAFIALAHLHQLAGTPENALKCLEGALALEPNDGQAILEYGRLLISLGEYEKAAVAMLAFFGADRQDRELLLQGRYLGALLEAFRSGNTQGLAALAAEKDFSDYRSTIYFILWKLNELPSYQNLLTGEFPQSPEAQIAGGKAISAITPLWLLFPGRESISLSTPVSPAPPVPVTPAAPVAAAPAGQAAPGTSAPVMNMLQAGLFGQEDNAKALAERLRKAGFVPELFQRRVNNIDYWAVGVPAGSDTSAMINKLKSAGFEAFPIK